MIAGGMRRRGLSTQITARRQAGARHSIPAAALRYFAIVFVLGFLVGTIRTLFVTPVLGETVGLLVELPVMLLVSMAVARNTLTFQRIARPAGGLAVGLLAFLMLMATEGLMAWLLTGQGPGEWAGSLVGAPGWIGFLGQIAFAFIPLLETWLNQRVIARDRARYPRRPPPGGRTGRQPPAG